MKYLLPFAFILAGAAGLPAQSADFPRDTSYTIYSAHRKISRDYPDARPVAPDLPPRVEEWREVVYATVGRRELHVDVFYPRRIKRRGRPGVLLIHGGGWRSGDKSNLVPMAQRLAAAGYVTAAAEYRLSLEAAYPAAVHDLKAALRWMRANAATFGLDTNQVAALGCSAGAQLASLLGATNGHARLEGGLGPQGHSSNVQAVVNIDGVVSFVHPDAGPERVGIYSTSWLGGPYADNLDIWTEASPLEHAGPATPPFLFLNSSHPRFHAGRDELIEILHANGTYSEVHTFEGSPHSFWLVHPWFEPSVELTVAFLRKVF